MIQGLHKENLRESTYNLKNKNNDQFREANRYPTNDNSTTICDYLKKDRTSFKPRSK